MHDVIAPNPGPVKKSSVGPVDELRNFTLVDFRRLSDKPEDAVEKIKDKFDVLREESFLLYLNGKEAWQSSPLCLQYQENLSKSLF